jgi:hypothetical protein
VSKVEIDLVDFPILDYLSTDSNLFMTLDSMVPVLANPARVEVFLESAKKRQENARRVEEGTVSIRVVVCVALMVRHNFNFS